MPDARNNTNYASNSYASKKKEPNDLSETRSLKSSSSASLKKKGAGRWIFETFVSEDFTDIKSFIIQALWKERAVPAIKDLVVDSVQALLFGNSVRGRSSKSSGQRISYSEIFSSKPNRSTRDLDRSTGVTALDGDLSYDTRVDAEMARADILRYIDEYGSITVAKIVEDILHLTPEHTDNKYGWYDLTTMTIVQSGGKYILRLPRAQYLG